MSINQVKAKAQILSSGVHLTDSVLDNFGHPYLEKRRAYGNQDPINLRSRTIPQELRLQPQDLVVAASVRYSSKNVLDFDGEKYFVTMGENGERVNVDFSLRPEFYDYVMSTRQKVSQVITLYGGHSLGIFVYGDCAHARSGEACHFCSVAQNRSKGTDFVDVIKPVHVKEALSLALQDTRTDIRQVMINGGNFIDLDKNFGHYLKIVKAAREAIDHVGRCVDLHLIVSPPNDLALIDQLADFDLSVAMNTEVYEPDSFKRFCPGKARIIGQDQIYRGLSRATKVLGEGRVYSIFVGGLESLDSLEKGLNNVSNIGVVPVINVLHIDPETPLATSEVKQPSADYIMSAGKLLQSIYTTYGYKPFYDNCGRNSLDTEAFKQLF